MKYSAGGKTFIKHLLFPKQLKRNKNKKIYQFFAKISQQFVLKQTVKKRNS